ncbi:MAG TPA: hypothetical protein VFS20_01475 [Longimicrobium sp.]|nr:hypothetical protein [Longimicrobium sp.]
MGIRRTPPLSLEGSREVREEMARGPEDTPERRRFMALVREMQERRKQLALEEELAAKKQ